MNPLIDYEGALADPQRQTAAAYVRDVVAITITGKLVPLGLVVHLMFTYNNVNKRE